MTAKGNLALMSFHNLITKKMKQSNHHCIPVSLRPIHTLPNGKVNQDNLVLIDNDEHVTIHKTLNIDYLVIRNFIMKLEYKIVKDEEYYTELHKMQSLYFLRLPLLPQHLQEIHAESLRKQCNTLNELYSTRLQTYQNMVFYNSVEKFRFYHSVYLSIFIEASRW